LLDHLYGLLDPAETAVIEEHLAGCSDCAASLARAANDHSLIARAAKISFPHIQFSAPTTDTAPLAAVHDSSTTGQAPGRTVPSSLAVSQPARRRTWARWAIAASLLVLASGILIPLKIRSGRYELARQSVDEAGFRLVDARGALDQTQGDAARKRHDAEQRFAAAQERLKNLDTELGAANRTADEAAKNRDVAVTVMKPVTLQPGAPNDLTVFVKSRGKALEGQRIEAEVRDQTGAVLHSQPVVPQTAAAVRIPANVWTKLSPQSELFLTVAAVDQKTGIRTNLEDPIRLAGPVYSTLLVTDKPTYRPGEPVYFRSLTLDRVSFRPPIQEQVLHYSLRRKDNPTREIPGTQVEGTTAAVRLIGGRAEPVRGPDGYPIRGVGCGMFSLPTDLSDGEYLLTLNEFSGPGDVPPAVAYPAVRTITIRSGAPERFVKTIHFDAASYSPGQPVVAQAKLQQPDGKPVAATASVLLTVDGQPEVVGVTPHKASVPFTDKDGQIRIQFGLPKTTRGDVRVMVTFRTPEGEETIAKRVPVVSVEFFPEGGQLVAGVPSRVYVRMTTPTGQPVIVRGVVTDGLEEVAKIVSPPADIAVPGAGDGLASFTLTPKIGKTYRLKLDGGRGGPAGFELPKAVADGVVMTVLDPVTTPGQPIRVRLQATGPARNLVVGAYIRGRLAEMQRVTVQAGNATEIKLLANDEPRGGVTRITVFQEPDPAALKANDLKANDLIPVAERLVFRRPGERLTLSVKAGEPGTAFAPGSPVDLTISAQDEKGNPAAAILWAAVVNSAITPSSTDRSLPTHFLLAGEIQTPDDLEYADFLLTDHPQAANALDLVLATQGWRKFVEQQSLAGLLREPKRKLAAESLLVMNGSYPVPAEVATTREHRRLVETYRPRYEAAEKEVATARKVRDEVAMDRSAEPLVRRLFSEYEERRQELSDLAASARSAAESLAEISEWAGIAAGAFGLLAAALWVVAISRSRGPQEARPLLVATVVAGALAGYLALLASNPPSNPDANFPGADDPPAAPPVGPTNPPAATLKEAPSTTVGPNSTRLGPSSSGSDERFGMAPLGPGDGRSELFVTSSIQPPVPHPPAGKGPLNTAEVRPPLVWPGRPDAGKAIPAHLIVPSRMSKVIPAGQAKPVGLTTHQLAEEQAVASLLADARSSSMKIPPLLVREFAAPRLGAPAVGGNAGTDTILWQPLIILPADGKSPSLTFHTGNAPGGYQILVAGHTLDGRLGSTRMILPVAPAVKIPPAVAK
jgi:hypothetical protein